MAYNQQVALKQDRNALDALVWCANIA